MRKDYFYLHMKEDGGGAAYSPESNNIEIIDDLNKLRELPFKFTLKDGPFQDYLLNDLAWPIFSERFKNLLTNFLSGQNIQWIAAKITESQDKEHTAYVLKFNDKVDILDKDKTIYAENDFVVKAVLSEEKVKNLDVCLIPDSDFQIIISQDVKAEIERNRLTGAHFSKVPIA